MKALLAPLLVVLLPLLGTMASAAQLTVSPTLLPSSSGTLVTASISGGRFYTGTVPPPYRIRLFKGNQLLNLLEPEKMTQTRLTFRFPQLEPGFYGFLVRAQDPDSGVWGDVYESSPRFFRVQTDDDPTQVFAVFQRDLPTIQQNTWEFLETTNLTARGTINGSIQIPQYVNDGDQVLNLEFLGDFPGSGENGVKFKLDFILDGFATYTFAIPFEINYDFPLKAYNGQTVHFKARSIRFPGGDSLQVVHTKDYSTDHSLWINAPYDCLPPFEVSFSQKPDRLQLAGSVPTVPCADAFRFNTSVFGEFADGDAEFGGVHNRLGGHASFVNRLSTGGRIESSNNVYRRLFTGTTRKTGLWYSSGDQIYFLARAGLGYVSAAAGLLDMDPPNVDLRQEITLDLVSTDSVQLKPPFLYDLRATIPSLASGTSYRLTNTCSIPIESSLVSQHIYSLTTSIVFDMICVDPQPLGSWKLADIYSTNIVHSLSLTAKFPLDVVIEVMPAPVWGNQFAPGLDLSITHVDVMNYAQADAIAEQLRLDGLVLVEPQRPTNAPTRVMMPIVPKPESACVLTANASPAPAGTITTDPPAVDGGYAAGTVVTVSAHPVDGFAFAGWSGDLTGSRNPESITMNSYRMVTANFISIPALHSGMSEGGFRLAWDQSATGFQLESAETLTPPITWEPIPGTTNNQITLPMVGTSRFYRLRWLR